MEGAEVAIDTSVDIAGQLGSNGYAVVRSNAFRLSAGADEALTRLCDSYRDLPLDRYLADGGRYRYRRYGAFRVSPDVARLQVSRPYYQSMEVNRFAGGVGREFAPLNPPVEANTFLTALLRFNVGRLPVRGTADWHVDVHLVRVTASPGCVGRPSPEGVHRDGFDYVSIHLVELAGGPSGGRTDVIRPGGGLVARTRLTRRLDSLYLDDRALLHDVTPLVATSGRAYRDVLLVSYRRGGRAAEAELR